MSSELNGDVLSMSLANMGASNSAQIGTVTPGETGRIPVREGAQYGEGVAGGGLRENLYELPKHNHRPRHDVSRCTVRVKTTVWADKRGLHTKKSLTFLHRQCEGFNVLAEDARAIGAEEVWPRIVNLGEVEDGIYEVVVCNERRDYETGYVDDYDYRLVTADVRIEPQP